MISPRFGNFFPFIMKWECVRDKKGRVIAENDPDDPGGLTKYGIDHRSHPKVNIRQLTETQARNIYWKEYWLKNQCETLPPGLGEVHFNACVNAGAGRAAKLMAASQGSWHRYLDEQEAFYRRLAASKPSLGKFLKGWLNRTADLRKHLTR
jgi:Glycosyl hydrolase 108